MKTLKRLPKGGLDKEVLWDQGLGAREKRKTGISKFKPFREGHEVFDCHSNSTDLVFEYSSYNHFPDFSQTIIFW